MAKCVEKGFARTLIEAAKVDLPHAEGDSRPESPKTPEGKDTSPEFWDDCFAASDEEDDEPSMDDPLIQAELARLTIKTMKSGDKKESFELCGVPFNYIPPKYRNRFLKDVLLAMERLALYLAEHEKGRVSPDVQTRSSSPIGRAAGPSKPCIEEIQFDEQQSSSIAAMMVILTKGVRLRSRFDQEKVLTLKLGSLGIKKGSIELAVNKGLTEIKGVLRYILKRSAYKHYIEIYDFDNIEYL